MVKLYATLAVFLISIGIHAQCFVQLQCTNVLCFGDCNGSATAYANGVPPFNYIWSVSLSNAQTVTGLCAGTVTVTVIDSLGCQATATCQITEPPQLQASIINIVNPSCPTCCDGGMSANATGGVPAYTWMWTGPSGFSSWQGTIANLCAGTYTLCVTDMNGCTTCTAAPISSPTGLSEQSSSLVMNVFSNDGSQFVVNATLSQPAPGEIIVTDLIGQVVYRQEFGPGMNVQETIDLSAASAGLYFISVSTTQGISTQRIIKQ